MTPTSDPSHFTKNENFPEKNHFWLNLYYISLRSIFGGHPSSHVATAHVLVGRPPLTTLFQEPCSYRLPLAVMKPTVVALPFLAPPHTIPARLAVLMTHGLLYHSPRV